MLFSPPAARVWLLTVGSMCLGIVLGVGVDMRHRRISHYVVRNPSGSGFSNVYTKSIHYVALRPETTPESGPLVEVEFLKPGRYRIEPQLPLVHVVVDQERKTITFKDITRLRSGDPPVTTFLAAAWEREAQMPMENLEAIISPIAFEEMQWKITQLRRILWVSGQPMPMDFEVGPDIRGARQEQAWFAAIDPPVGFFALGWEMAGHAKKWVDRIKCRRITTDTGVRDELTIVFTSCPPPSGWSLACEPR